MRSRSRSHATVVTAIATLLGASGLGSIFVGWSWLLAATTGIAVVSAVSISCRAGRVPVVFQPILGAAALLVLCTARFAPADAYARIVPTPGAWEDLRQQYSFGIHVLTATNAPYPTTTGTLFIITAGVGLIMLAADLIAVGAERPSLAGIALLALIVVPAAAPHGGLGWLPFCLVAIGYLALLTLDAGDRARRWGRSLDGPGTGAAGTAGSLARAGWRIGALSLGIALVIPIAIPGAHHSRLSGGSAPGGGGNNQITVVNPFVTINSQLHNPEAEPLLSVRSNNLTYERLTSLDVFDDRGFSLQPLSSGSKDKVSRGLPAPTSGVAAVGTTETLRATDRLAEPFLPVPQSPTFIHVEGDWRIALHTGSVFSSRTTTSGKTWTVTALVPAPTAAQLDADGPPRGGYGNDLAVDLTVPVALPPVVGQTARTWVAQAGAVTEYQIANAIQQTLRGPGFTYDLNATIDGGVFGFAKFLQQRRGYCQQFASTMVAMLRTLNIPARVAIGFTPGMRQADGSDLITNRDAHAWPEVWFPSAGWVRFEPTPLGGRGLTPAYAQPGPGSGVVGPSTPAVVTPTPSASPTPGLDGPNKPNGRTQGATPTQASGPGGDGWWWGGLAAAVVLLVAAAPRALRWAHRRRRWRRAAALGSGALTRAAWADLLEDAADRGVAVPRSASPREVGRRLVSVLSLPADRADAADAIPGGDASPPGRISETEAGAVRTLVTAVERTRYAAPGASAGPPDRGGHELEAAVRTVREGLNRELPRARRLMIVLWPPAALRDLVAGLRAGLAAPGALVDSLLGRVGGAGRHMGTHRP